MPASSSKQAAASAASKPYDRPSKGSTKGKGKAAAAPSTTSAGVNIGAPATHGQSSRKGKKAWRKNVDITAEETALEQGREEERITGGKVAERRNDDLFMVDTVGDVAVAQKLRRAPKPLRSLAILNERSAVPSLTSKSIIAPTSSASKTKSRISSAEKERLRRIARRTAVDPDGITTSAEIKTVGPALTDAWNAASARAVPVGEFGEEGIVKAKVKTPITIARQREIYLSNQVAGGRGLETPDQGTSYNPKEADHTRLIELAVEEEKAQLAREAAEEERIRVLGEVKNARRQHADGDEFEYAPGMKVGPGEIDEDDVSEDDDDEDAAGPSKTKAQKRKTQAQRNKAKRLKEQARLDAIEKTHKRLVASIGGLKGVQANLEKREKQMAEAERLAKLAKKQRERMGLEGGEKVGKHRVVKPRVTVQLGEDLAESLRQVKPEGNLFRDRYLALQRKALVEPRVKQMHKRHKLRTKEYEKHAYKRFQ